MDPRAILALASMVTVFVIINVGFKQKSIPLSLQFIIACVAASVAAGFGIPLRHMVEGTFGYFYIVLVILMAVIYLKVLQANGCLEGIVKSITKLFGRSPVLLLFVGMTLLYLPGMVTGLGVPAVMGIGALIGPVFLQMGIPAASVAAIITMGAMLGSVTGPLNIPAMVIGTAINMPFEGFGKVLPAFTVPLGIITLVLLGLKPALSTDKKALMEKFRPEESDLTGFRIFLPVLVVVILMVVVRVFPERVVDLGTPLIFLIGTIVALFCGRRIPIWRTLVDAVDSPILDIASLLLTVGVVVQITTLTGVRGIIVVAILGLPTVLFYVSMITLLPLFGGLVSMLGATAILGVPFATYLLGKNIYVLVAAISVLCGISQYIPPTAICGLLAQYLLDVDSYGKVMRKLAIPTVICLLLCLFAVIFSEQFASVLAL